MAMVNQRSALEVLTKARLVEVADALGLGVPGRWLKADLVDAIASSTRAPFPLILELLSRNELKAICRAVGIDDSGRAKAVIATRILSRGAGGMDTLTKADLAEAGAAATGLYKQTVEVIVNTVFESIIESLQAGETIELRGFGSFHLRDRPARVGRNPKTGKRVDVPAKRVCYFKPGKALRKLV